MVDIIHNKPMTLKAAAAWMSVSTKTIREWASKGSHGRRLDTIQFGKQIYTTLDNLQRFGFQRGGELTYSPEQSALERNREEGMRILREDHGHK